MIKEPGETNPHEEPCLKCGEGTSVGTIWYSDRREAQLPDGTRGYLCSECVKRLRAAGHPEVQSDLRGAENSVISLTGGWL
jgi:hypothetical protein